MDSIRDCVQHGREQVLMHLEKDWDRTAPGICQLVEASGLAYWLDKAMGPQLSKAIGTLRGLQQFVLPIGCGCAKRPVPGAQFRCTILLGRCTSPEVYI
jgi:hypothetical protein